MIERALVSAVLWAFVALSPAHADGRTPGSVLVYTMHRSSPMTFTALSVTNTDLRSAGFGTVGGTTQIHWEYMNVLANPASRFMPLDCSVQNRVEVLTPGDTRAVLARCHNATTNREGYAVVTARNPTKVDEPWSHNELIGSEIVVNALKGFYALNAAPFESIQPKGQRTDIDNDGQLDFDGIEYEGVPDDLYGEFVALAGSSLTLLNLSGGTAFTANITMDLFNDAEMPMSVSFGFRCWFEEALEDISIMFSEAYLKSVPNDPTELDLDCDNDDDAETGWFRIRGNNYSSPVDTCLNPALLGSITAGPRRATVNGGHLLWESDQLQFNGDFFKTGTDDPECPEVPLNTPPVCDIQPVGPIAIDLGAGIQFDGSGSFDPDGTIDRFDWDFGDGTSISDGPDMVNHTYTSGGPFTVRLTVSDDDSRSRSCTTNVFVNTRPECSVVVQGTNMGDVGDTFTIDASGSFDPDGGNIVRYDWDFGDGTMLPNGGPIVQHTYNAFGVYTVKVTLTDDEGSTNLASPNCETMVIVNVSPNCIPGGPYSGNVGQPIQFNGCASFDPNGSITRFDWDFGDGTVLNNTVCNPSHSYATGGDFVAKLTITDNLNRKSVCMVPVFVNAIPVCDAGGSYTVDVCKDLTFNGSGSFDPDGGSLTFDWFYGDGQSDLNAGPNPKHAYQLTGDYTVNLRITDEEGRSQVCMADVTVNTIAGAMVWIGSDIDEHCSVESCAGMGRQLLRFVYENSRGATTQDPSTGKGVGILAIGLQDIDFLALDDLNQPAAVFTFGTWTVTPAGPFTVHPPLNVPITTVSTLAELMAEDLNDYRMLYVPSFEGFVPGGIDQSMINAMNSMSAEILDFTRRQGGGLMCLTQVSDPQLPVMAMNAYQWSPIPFLPRALDFEDVCATCDLNGSNPCPAMGNAFPAPMTNASATMCGPFDDQTVSLGHEAWHNLFDPVAPMADFDGLVPLGYRLDEMGTLTTDIAILGGIADSIP